MDRAPFQLRLLGPTELIGPPAEPCDAVIRQSKRLALLAYLALATADGFRRRDPIVALFWPELDQIQARTNLRKALHGIRDALGEDVFVTRGEEEIRLDDTRLRCDAVELLRHAQNARWRDALDLYRGDLLEGLYAEGAAPEFQQWLDEQRSLLRRHAARAAWECSREAELRGELAEATVLGRRGLELEPDDEDGVRRLMDLLDRRGDRAGALRVYEAWCVRLREEFGVEPAPETRRIARRVQAARKGESHDTPPVPPSALAPAAPIAPSPTRTDQVRIGDWRRRIVWAAFLVVVGAASGAWVIREYAFSGAHANPHTIEIRPLRPIGDASTQAVADAVAEELTTALAADSALTVHLTAFERNSAPSAAYVAEGGVQRASGRFRVTLRLVRTADAIAIWGGSYDVDEGDLAEGARRVAGDAASAIRARLSLPRI